MVSLGDALKIARSADQTDKRSGGASSGRAKEWGAPRPAAPSGRTSPASNPTTRSAQAPRKASPAATIRSWERELDEENAFHDRYNSRWNRLEKILSVPEANYIDGEHLRRFMGQHGRLRHLLSLSYRQVPRSQRGSHFAEIDRLLAAFKESLALEIKKAARHIDRIDRRLEALGAYCSERYVHPNSRVQLLTGRERNPSKRPGRDCTG